MEVARQSIQIAFWVFPTTLSEGPAKQLQLRKLRGEKASAASSNTTTRHLLVYKCNALHCAADKPKAIFIALVIKVCHPAKHQRPSLRYRKKI
jgi:hypothetical protein